MVKLARLAQEAGPDDANRIIRAYRLAFARLPSDTELGAVLAFLARQQAQIETDSKGKMGGDDARIRALPYASRFNPNVLVNGQDPDGKIWVSARLS